jgi:hypothetical protein
MTRNSVLRQFLLTVGVCSFSVLAAAATPSGTPGTAAPDATATAAATPSTKSDNKSLHHTDDTTADP